MSYNVKVWMFFFAIFIGIVFLLLALRFVFRKCQQYDHYYKETHRKVVFPSIGSESNGADDKFGANRSNRIPSKIPFIILLAALGLFFSLASIVKTNLQTYSYVVTYGKVVSPFIGLESEGSGDSFKWVKYHLPVIEYRVKGRTYKIEYRESIRREALRTGTLLKIGYHPKSPGNAIIASKMFRDDFFGLFVSLYAITFLLVILFMDKMNAELSVRTRIPLLCLGIGIFLAFAILFNNKDIGFLNSFATVLSAPVSIVFWIFLVVVVFMIYFSVIVAGLIIFFYVKDSIATLPPENRTKNGMYI